MFKGGQLGGKFAGNLLLQWKGEYFVHRKHLKFCHFQPVHYASKNPISSTVFNRFSKSLPQLEDVEGGHLGGRFSGAQVFYFCSGKVKTLHIENIWNFATFNFYTVPEKTQYLQRFSTDFRNLCLSSKMLRVDIWAESFNLPRYFTFAMAMWKLCTLTTFEILPLSICTLCQQKSHISKGIQRIFEIIASARRYWGWAFRRKVSGAHLFYKMGRLKLRATFALSTWTPAKTLYLQRYSTDFRNHCVSSKMLRVDIWAWKVLSGAAKTLYLQRYFTFAMARWKLCNGMKTLKTFEILPLSTWTLCQQKPNIFSGIQPIFEIFASALRSWGWTFGRKVSGAHVFYF